MSADETSPLLPSTDQDDAQPAAVMSTSILWKTGAVFGATAVGMGAFGAHSLRARISDPQKLANWSTAAQYQASISTRTRAIGEQERANVLLKLVHSVAVLVASNNPIAGTLFTAGMTLFSGSIYALTLDTERFRFLGPVTPLGGLCLIAGWLALAFGKRGAAFRLPRP
ncbi:hypothetical protein MMYC01_208696 [Madurella mycetomatis]|uniref:Uncharacterized protein n=1 Tax=Madurella mycetomatis TaxID=100816 RepID=A0A175VR35_9PEZI|nr:hypothetical protein MMYC01_208722 [Madurella mycetomatis]KXX75474.1 hypothetical protein MMYC01_208696 [Madurella mycetomatis]